MDYGLGGEGVVFQIWGVVCLNASPLFASAGNGWLHNAQLCHYDTPHSWHFTDF